MKGLRRFQVIRNGKPLTGELVTTREFGRWFQEVYSPKVCFQFLYLNNKNIGAQYHPGTKIGTYFDNHDFSTQKLISTYIPTDSEVYKYLMKTKLITPADTISIREKNSKVSYIRCYTVDQIKLYLKEVAKSIRETPLDPYSYLGKLFKINVIHYDCNKYLFRIPAINKNALFNTDSSDSDVVRKKMSVAEIEKELGYKISIIS